MSVKSIIRISNVPSFPSSYYEATATLSASGQTELSIPAMQLDVGGMSFQSASAQTLDIDSDSSWDFGQNIGTWTANHSYSEGDWVRPSALGGDGANNVNTTYASHRMFSATSSYASTQVASATSTHTTYYPYHAFDQSPGFYNGGNFAGTWYTAQTPTTESPQSLMLDFGRNVCINKYAIQGSYDVDYTRTPRAWILQGTNTAGCAAGDAKNVNGWTDLDAREDINAVAGASQWTPYFTFVNTTQYRFYRLRITNYNLSYICIGELKLVEAPFCVYKCTSSGTSLSSEPTWGTTVGGTTAESGGPTWTCYYDYTSATNRAGTDFYLYACQPETNITPTFLLSANSTYPSGYTASNSRKIGGFHGLCASVGTIANHTLSGYLTGDILPQSVWCLKHRSASGSNVGLVYIPPLKKWCAIYLTSGTSGAPTIVFGGTILDTITYFVSSDAARVKKMQLPSDYEFGVLAEGSNQGTNILGSADPVTVTSAVDTAGRRMISNYGVEGCAGVMWQWLCDTSYRFYGATAHTHSITVSGDPQTVTSGGASADVAPAWSWKAETGGKGSLYTQGTYGAVKLLAGGRWLDGTYCGSLAHRADYWPWAPDVVIGFRAITNTIEK